MSSGASAAGAGLSTVATPASRAMASARAAAGKGCSNWVTNTAAARMASAAASTSASEIPVAAPVQTTMAFSPEAASTSTAAAPVAAASERATSGRTPASAQAASPISAKESRPIRDMNCTSAPSRAAATAWFDPLPPGLSATLSPMTVSPIRGRRGVRKAASTTKMPRIAMRAVMEKTSNERPPVEPRAVRRRDTFPACGKDRASPAALR